MMSTFYKICNHDPERIFSYEGVNYYAADEDGAKRFAGDLILNLTKSPSTKTISNAYNIPQLSKHMIDLPEEIILGWDDYSTPPVKKTFWQGLHKYCKQKKYEYVCLRCQQGHGRTGTALVAMMIANLGCSFESAIEDVRERYCKDAVESNSQIVYLIDLDTQINGRPFMETNEVENILNKYLPKIITKFKSGEHSNFILHPDANDSDDDIDLRKIFKS